MNKLLENKLRQLFRSHGYARCYDPKKRKKRGSNVYKKGYEIRLIAYSYKELQNIQEMLDKVGFRRGRPFMKHKQWVQPLYGKEIFVFFTGKNEKIK